VAGGPLQENLTARGTIIKNLQTLQTNLDVKTFLWYLVEKIQGIERLDMSVFHLFACFCCRRNWNRLRLINKGEKRFKKWSDITTLLKAKLNSDMLVQRLLDSE